MRLALLALSLLAGMIHLPAARVTLGDRHGDPDERHLRRVQVAAFDLDRDEVSVRDYRACVSAGRCRAPEKPLPQAGGSDADPVTWVSWRDAADYCRYAGKRLPSEAEWERAARGPSGRAYPWGARRSDDVPDCARANFGNYRGEGRCPKNPGRPVPPGRYPTGNTPEGVRDLAGNVWEWVADGYDPHGYRGNARPGAPRVLRGGACCSMFGLPRAANRVAFPPDYRDEDIGFRCAR